MKNMNFSYYESGDVTVFEIYDLKENEWPKFLRDTLKNQALSIITKVNTISFTVATEVDIVFDLYKKLSQLRGNMARMENVFIADGVFTNEDIDKIFDIQNGVCYYTGKQLVETPKNYGIDHIVPVSEGGSNWPENLALALKINNSEKNVFSKQKYLNILEKKYGKEWRIKQGSYCKNVDKKRRAIDKERKKYVEKHINDFENKLKDEFPHLNISYSLVVNAFKIGSLELEVDKIVVTFPGGFLRKKRMFNSYEYLSNIVKSISSKAHKSSKQ